MRLTSILMICATAGLASGCVGRDAKPASVLGGECKLLVSPEYAVLGKTSYDQRWINRTEESIVVGCGQPRPKARPAELDAPPARVPRATSPASAPVASIVDYTRLNGEAVRPAPVVRASVSPLVPAGPAVMTTRARPVVRDRQPLWQRLREIWKR